MKTPRFIFLLLVAAISYPMSVSSGAEPLPQTENIQRRIAESEFIVDICVYEMEWIPPAPVSREFPFPRATLVERAVITGVHKGTIPIGTKLEYCFTIEEPPKLFSKRFRTVVEGEIYTFFFSHDNGTFENGKYTLRGDGHFRFRLRDEDFAEAFQRELKTNPALKRKSEQGGGGNAPEPPSHPPTAPPKARATP
jgi:hypothetical protein